MKKASATGQRLSGAERRAQIIRVATQLFAQKGFNGTTIRQIAEAANISETLIFQHFHSKEGLYAAVLTQLQERPPHIPELEELMQKKDDAGVFRLLAWHLTRHIVEDATFTRLMMFSALEVPQLFDSFLHSANSPLTRMLGTYIQSRIEDGAFKDINPFIAAQGFIAMVTNYIAEREILTDERPHLSYEEMVRTMVTIFLQGVTLRGQHKYQFQEVEPMETVTLDLPAMYADHHVQAVRGILTNLSGVGDVFASAALKRVTVSYDPTQISPPKLEETLRAAGYPPEGQAEESTGLPPRQGDPGWTQQGMRVTQTDRRDLEMSGDFRKY